MENTEILELELEQEETQQDQYLTFQIGKEEYGIEIKYVTQILGMQDITKLPNQTHYIQGVINLRGKVVPVIDVRLRFDLEEREYNERTCIIVVDINSIDVGLIVDLVQEVINIPDSNIELPPQIASDTKNQFIQGLGKVDEKVKIILDAQKLLFEAEVEQLAETLAE